MTVMSTSSVTAHLKLSLNEPRGEKRRDGSDEGGQKCDAHGEKVAEERESNRGASNYPDSGAVYGHPAL